MNKFENCDIYFPGSEIEFSTIFNKVYDNGKINYFRLTEFPNSAAYPLERILPGVVIVDTVGDDLTVVVVGALLDRIKNVVNKLEARGKSIEILYAHTIKPLDFDTIEKSVRKTQRLLVVEENHESGGVYSALVSKFGGDFTFAKKQIAIQGFLKTYGTYEALTFESGLSEEQILYEAVEIMSK
jgi:transketolase